MASRTFSHYPYRTPYGILTICASDAGIARIAFGDVALEGSREPSTIANRAINEILEYFSGKRRSFDVPLDLSGTEFQKAVWSRVARVPYGKTTTNALIAEAMGDAGGFRAVGSAVKRNPAPIVVPTHRVIGANGRPLPGEAAPDVFAGLRRLESSVIGDGELSRY